MKTFQYSTETQDVRRRMYLEQHEDLYNTCYYLLHDCPMDSIVSLLRGQPHKLHISLILAQWSAGAL